MPSACTTSRAAGPARTRRTSSSSTRRNDDGSRARQACRIRIDSAQGRPAEADEQVRLLVDAETPVVTIFGKTWLLHVREVLQTTPEENLAMIDDTVRYLKQHGRVRRVRRRARVRRLQGRSRVRARDAGRRPNAAAPTSSCLCDTNGGSIPAEIAAITRDARARLGVRIGIHTHDDIGLGVANALAAIEAGATHVQGTINGYRRAYRQLQPDDADPESRVQAEEVARFQPSRCRC